MNIRIIAVGKLKEDYLRDAQKEYSKRLSRFCKLNIVEADEDFTLEKEADRIRKALTANSHVIALAIEGKKYDSVGFARYLENLMISGKSHISFIIGGSDGLDESILTEADNLLSMSDMTFPHQLARIILLEQIYRAFKIINNETYHK
ncbi:MAG: 23S rRNA (pseudouridine(1915)-N(3))-methyltransferase RlmH [Clostridiaceae bacterium]|jgi:23S rRNA (pseudouridine1915-N3)-methyltransferase|nr:23S rRNA (pseudouridine(1915)-N(3))-methyltransferase RlmH [Clostridiaceae bacterium]